MNVKSIYKRLRASSKQIRNHLVPIYICGSKSAREQDTLSLAFIGWDRRLRHYWQNRLFGAANYRCRRKWKLTRHMPSTLENLKQKTDLMLIESDYMRQSLSGFPRKFLLPRWMEMELELESASKKKWVKDVRRRIKKYSLECEFKDSQEDFELFYQRMYKPMLKIRYGVSAEVADYRIFLKKFRTKGSKLLFITRFNKPVAGLFMEKREHRYRIDLFGVLDGSEEVIKMGVHAALYYYVIQDLLESGERGLLCGSSMPIALDGVTQFKLRIGAKPHLQDLEHRKKYYFIPLSSTPSLKLVLAKNPLLFLHEGQLQQALFFPSVDDSGKDSFLQAFHRMTSENVSKSIIYKLDASEKMVHWLQEAEINNLEICSYESAET